jgi:hypothetical protein
MTDITSDCTFYYMIAGDLKIINVVMPATAATGNTIDLATDSAGGKINTILNTLLQDDAGADKACTWVPGTGVITLGTITTGIHNLTVVGI